MPVCARVSLGCLVLTCYIPSPCRRTRSLHGPCPVTTFGPKACVLQNPQTVMHIQDPASQRLTWNKPPKSVLVIKKIRDSSLLKPFKELCVYLSEVSGPGCPLRWGDPRAPVSAHRAGKSGG